MDQAALLGLLSSFYDKLVDDVAVKVLSKIETERVFQPAESPYVRINASNYQTLVADVAKHAETSLLAIKHELGLDMDQLDYEKLANQINWRTFAKDVAVNFSTSDVVSEIDLSNLANCISLSDLAGEIDLNDLAGSIDLNDLAGEFDLSDLAGELDMSDLASTLVSDGDLGSQVADLMQGKLHVGWRNEA